MSSFNDIFVGDAHSYTRSETPWILGDQQSFSGKLIRYISGGGMRTFGRTVKQEEARRRHRRFLVVSALLTVIWTFFYFI